MRKQVPPDKMNSVLDFAIKRPNDRLESIVSGMSVCFSSAFLAKTLTFHPKVLDHGQSEYVREFGMTVANEPIKILARVLTAPTLRYHPSSELPSVVRNFPFEKSNDPMRLC